MADVLVRPDGRKSLTQLREEWANCIRCSLGEQRIDRSGSFVFGRGARNGIMFIGEGPGVDEEKQGLPFVGKSGDLLHGVLARLGFDNYYETNLVTCRSCTPRLDEDGNPIFRTNFATKARVVEQVFQDEPPTPPQYLSCMPRLQEEIYLVDPVVIVGLGGKACEALLGRSITITRDRGEPAQIGIAGASYSPVLTEKKQEWLHRVKGEDGKTRLTTVNEQNMVPYYLMPTLHPAYVLRKLADQGPDSPFRQFVADIKRAVRTYEQYCELVFGDIPSSTPAPDDETLHAQIRAENDE